MTEKYYYQHHCQFRPCPDADLLRRLYVDEKRSLESLLELFHTSYPSLTRWLRELGIPRRGLLESSRRRDLDPQVVKEMYVDRMMTFAEIQRELKTSAGPIRRALKAAQAAVRSCGPQEHRKRKPVHERVFDKQGYALVKRPDHPRANRRGYVREHILSAETKLGRPVQPHEVVHHEDEVKSNNAPENLGLFPSRGEHIRFHNLQRSSAKALHAMSDDDLRDLYSRMSTPMIAERFGTSPASVQRELVRRGMSAGQGRRPKGASDRRKHAEATPTSPTPTGRDARES